MQSKQIQYVLWSNMRYENFGYVKNFFIQFLFYQHVSEFLKVWSACDITGSCFFFIILVKTNYLKYYQYLTGLF